MENVTHACTILVVEDYADARVMYVEYLSGEGYGVIAAEDGLIALQIALAVVPEVIILDIQLPKLDGFSVLRRLRTDRRLDATVILTLSAGACAGYDEEAMEAGASRALRKPMLPGELLKNIEDARAEARTYRASSAWHSIA